jgi:RNA polymerase sigma-70 factor (ECF subfamily)
MQSDSELIQRSKAGESVAFKQLVERHEQQVRAIIMGMLGNTPEARDVAQEVFIRFYKSLDSFRGDAKLSTYLSRIAINLSLNELKRKQKRQKRYLFFQKDEKELQIEDRSSQAEAMETRDWIQQGLAQLEPEFKTIIVLRLMEGYSVKETAEILKLPQGTVASRLARAQKKLSTILRAIDHLKTKNP